MGQGIYDTKLKLSLYLRDELKAVIDPVVQRNAEFCHTENNYISNAN